tara:strand:+ start:3101 stop:4345 length:1245 start_codon:yes stop_codon:yes gene_type:complete
MAGGSTDLMTYLNYMSTWDTESDENINKLITEQRLFISLDNFDANKAIDDVFDVLIKSANEVKKETIAADSIQIAADAAAIASIWSFGLGMAVFASLEASEVIMKKDISSKSKALSDKLSTVDTDISSKIDGRVHQYVTQYKANNEMIALKATAGLNVTACRASIMQLMATVQKKSHKLDAETFRKYAASARLFLKSKEIEDVYDALDNLNFSEKTDEDINKVMAVLKNLKCTPEQLHMIQDFSLGIMFYKLNISTNRIKAQADAAGLPVEEVEGTAFEAMDAVGKFAASIVVIMSVVDMVFSVLNIVDVVKQCDKMCDELRTRIKESYKSYFEGIKEASQKYKHAVGLHPSAIVQSFEAHAVIRNFVPGAVAPSQLGLFSQPEAVQQEQIQVQIPEQEQEQEQAKPHGCCSIM